MTDTPAKPKLPGIKAKPTISDEQNRRFAELCQQIGTDDGETLDRVFGTIVPVKMRTEGNVS